MATRNVGLNPLLTTSLAAPVASHAQVLDRIVRWQGTRAVPVELGEVRDTLLALTMEYNSAEAVLDPHQAVLIAQEARGTGVVVHEFAFTSTSVGRLALSLHQAIRNHRMALPPDEDLLGELRSVRLRKNTLGVYRLDHESGQHDDQAVALALGVYHLLDTDPAPEFTILDTPDVPAGSKNVFGLEVLEQRGVYAYRPDPADPWANAAAIDDEDPPGEPERPSWMVRTVPFT